MKLIKGFPREVGMIFKSFLIWRILLFLIALLAALIISFGYRFPYWDRVLVPTNLPEWVWGFGNFDGVHYLRLAQNGYIDEYSQAFFPLYPILIKVFNFFPRDFLLNTQIFVDPSYFYTAIILSNLFFLVALYVFYKLIKLDYNRKVSFLSLVFLLIFPTSFYFGSVYTESLFLLLVVSAVFLARKRNYLLAGILAALASATKIQGALLFVVLLMELFSDIKNKRIKLNIQGLLKPAIGLAVAPLGLVAYMYYLGREFANPLYFLTSQPAFGAERTDSPFILLPQVFYRYAQMLVSVPVNSLAYFNIVVELGFVLLLIFVLIISFRKVRLSYWLFSLGATILPTLTGTFSSMPRYALMSFLLFPFIVLATKKYFFWLATLMVIVGVVFLSLFMRGYWVA